MAVHQLLWPVFRSAVMVPLVVTGLEPIERVELVDESPTEVTVPEPPPPPPEIHTPFIA